jgi:predicted nucleotidyltransferase
MTLERYIPSTSYALFLFGSLSHARDKANCVDGTSDVDLLVIVKDEVASQARKALPELNAIQHFLANNVTAQRGIVASILRVIERQTGMHESIFLSRERDFKDVRFASIFKTNRFLSWLLAPTHIVFGSALCHMTRVHGNETIEAAVRAMQSTFRHEKHVLPNLVRSLLMNAALATGAVVLLPLTKRATRYAVEATKWSMYAATYSMVGERPSKPSQKRFFSRLGVSEAFLSRWMQLSRHYVPDVKYTLATLWNVIKIHALGFKIKKIR